MLGQTIIQFPVADARTPAEGLARAAAFLEQFADDEMIVPALAPHAMYTNDADTLKARDADLSLIPAGDRDWRAPEPRGASRSPAKT